MKKSITMCLFALSFGGCIQAMDYCEAGSVTEITTCASDMVVCTGPKGPVTECVVRMRGVIPPPAESLPPGVTVLHTEPYDAVCVSACE